MWYVRPPSTRYARCNECGHRGLYSFPDDLTMAFNLPLSVPGGLRTASRPDWARCGASGSVGGAPGADFEAEDVGVRTDTPGFHEPLVDGCGDVAGCGVDAAGEVGGVEAAGLGGSVGALFSVVGALDDVAADAG